ncbi:hypothetical protein ACYSNW_15815 [Enterococcus sp. LJL99]
MTKKQIDLIKQEKEIPETVKKQLLQNRQRILNGEIEQKEARKVYKKGILLIIETAAIAITIGIILLNPQINSAIKNAIGLGVTPKQEIEPVKTPDVPVPSTVNLTSTQNGLEITLTKFVFTKKKLIFDYQFEIKDEQLKILLEKNIATGSNAQDIMYQLFNEGDPEDLNSDVTSYSSFRMEGNMFYGAVASTFDSDKIPEDAKLTLVINQLAWIDHDEFIAAANEPLVTSEGTSFSVTPALEYSGDWRFKLDVKASTQTATPVISNVENITDITAKSDELQTTVTFVAKGAINKDLLQEPQDALNKSYSATIYKNGIKAEEEQPTIQIVNPITGEFELSFNLSALDKESIYKVQVDLTDDLSGESIEKVGSFELQNK